MYCTCVLAVVCVLDMKFVFGYHNVYTLPTDYGGCHEDIIQITSILMFSFLHWLSTLIVMQHFGLHGLKTSPLKRALFVMGW